MKTVISVHNILYYPNRICVTLNIHGPRNDFVNACNKVSDICKKHNAQEHLFCNESHLVHDRNGDVVGFKNGNSGGTITFHVHSCVPENAFNELNNCINSL